MSTGAQYLSHVAVTYSSIGAMGLARLRSVVAVMVATACVAHAFYLPGVAPRDFAKVWL